MKSQNSLSCSEVTKKRLATALKELMETTPFEKISISDITNKCGMHRQTFYYHFQDRYELLDWLIYNELVVMFITDFNTDTLLDRFRAVFDKILSNREFYQRAFRINMTDMTKYISSISTEEFTRVISDIGIQNGVSPDTVDNQMIAEFFGYGISGVIQNWVNRGMKESPEEMIKKIDSFVKICRSLITNGNI